MPSHFEISDCGLSVMQTYEVHDWCGYKLCFKIMSSDLHTL